MACNFFSFSRARVLNSSCAWATVSGGSPLDRGDLALPAWAAFSPLSYGRFFGSRASPLGHTWRLDEEGPPRLLVVQPRTQPRTLLRSRLLEALRLADSLEDPRDGVNRRKQRRELPPFVVVQNPAPVHAGAYFGPGTISNVSAHVLAVSTKEKLDAVFVNAPLSAVQQRNLEDAWGKPVLDRVGLIIEIFGAHAQTKAAKLQVELAALNYHRSRLVRIRGKSGRRLGFGVGGESEVVSARGRATGAIGGAGETEIQLQRRRISARKHRLKSLLAEVDRTQTLHRLARTREGNQTSDTRVPVVAVVGYTNAGKSSLVAALSRKDMYIDDKLFATLDTRSRSVFLPSGKKVILSDTVGFISDLPLQLVDAFQATLKEVVDADYLLHVIDSSASNASEQRETVMEVLRNIGVSRYKMEHCLLEVWNKSDLSGEEIHVKGIEDCPELQGSNDVGESESMKALGESDFLTSDVDHPICEEAFVDESSSCDDKESTAQGVEWPRDCDHIPRVRVSVRTNAGLFELSRLLDESLEKNLAQDGVTAPIGSLDEGLTVGSKDETKG